MTVLAVLALAAASAANPPELPLYWSAEATQYVSVTDEGPPWASPGATAPGVPPPPLVAGRLLSYYDWTKQAMIEHYVDDCVPIFTSGWKFECKFLNLNNQALLITYNKTRPAGWPPCCLFRKPHHPPAPDFLAALNKSAVLDSPVGCRQARWWKMDIPPPAGPMWFPWFMDDVKAGGRSVYASFSFPVVPTPDGRNQWAQQNFFNYSFVQPPDSTWDIPPECAGAEAVPCPTQTAYGLH
eukprot:TRINITY_DN7814_c0_g1_i1.p2 TRINITY_DN7814_c0_g1~~TRINITY_DN7814_c0_g1_i1.p2  ORF type:complete len:240 (+),score=41.18 TRINITY_DN7814_c0_g1_i1:71-790(+)